MRDDLFDERHEDTVCSLWNVAPKAVIGLAQYVSGRRSGLVGNMKQGDLKQIGSDSGGGVTRSRRPANIILHEDGFHNAN